MKDLPSKKWDVIYDNAHGSAFCSQDGKFILTSTYNTKICGNVWRVFSVNGEIKPLNAADHLMDDPDKLVPDLTEEAKKKYWWEWWIGNTCKYLKGHWAYCLSYCLFL